MLWILDDGSERYRLGHGYAEEGGESLPGARDKVVGEYRVFLRFLDDAVLNSRTASLATSAGKVLPCWSAWSKRLAG